MADGGSIPMTYKVGGSDNMPEAQPSWYQDDGEKTFNIDNIQQLAKGGDVDSMKQELAAKSDAPKRIKIDAEGSGGVKGIVVPRHLLEKSSNSIGMNEINKARAKVYGSENRDPLTLGQMAKTHKTTLANHFSLPVEEQTAAEEAALNRLRQAKRGQAALRVVGYCEPAPPGGRPDVATHRDSVDTRSLPGGSPCGE
jgi:hypothetical protein